MTFRLAISLTEGGGLDIAPSSQGHGHTTLMRGVMQGHLLTYDFYTRGTPSPPPTPPLPA